VFSTTWRTSPRAYGVRRDRGTKVPTSSGVRLDCDVFRPDADGRFPVILSLAPYPIEDQAAPLTPGPMRYPNAHIEAGDPHFYARRGYVHVVGNLPGTGESEGFFDHMGPDTIRAVYDAIAWCAEQPWSDGNVGMFGMSYYGMIQPLVAMLEPPALKAIFCPFSVTDQYRDTYYKGGIFGYAFLRGWSVALRRARLRATYAESVGEDRFRELVERAKADPENQLVPSVMEVLADVDDPVNRFLAEIVVNPLLGEHYDPRCVDYSRGCTVPGYFGACWGIYGLHLPGAFRSFTRWNGPARLTIGPPAYLDRPIVQYQYESLRWFDHWLKGNDTGLMDEPPVQVFVDNANEWRSGQTWPLTQTRFTPFYLHENGLLFEREFWPHEPHDVITDSPLERGGVSYATPAFRDDVELCGPVVLTLFASTTGTEALFFASLHEVGPDGADRLLTRGWLRGSQRELDEDESTPWWPVHRHRRRVPMEPGEIYELAVDIRPIGVLLRAGSRLRLTIRTTDVGDPNPDILSDHAVGLVSGAQHNRVFIHHDEDHPSVLVLPVTRGNRIGTFLSGGRLEPLAAAHGTDSSGGGH